MNHLAFRVGLLKPRYNIYIYIYININIIYIIYIYIYIYTFLKGWNISQLGQGLTHRLSGTLILFPFTFPSVSSNLYSWQDIMHWACLQIHQPCRWRQLVSVRLRYAGSYPDIYSHPATETLKALQSVGIRRVLRKDPICSADFKL